MRYSGPWFLQSSYLPAYFSSVFDLDIVPCAKELSMIEGTRAAFFVDCGIQYKLYLAIKNCRISEEEECAEGVNACYRLHSEGSRRSQQDVHGAAFRLRVLCS